MMLISEDSKAQQVEYRLVVVHGKEWLTGIFPNPCSMESPLRLEPFEV